MNDEFKPTTQSQRMPLDNPPPTAQKVLSNLDDDQNLEKILRRAENFQKAYTTIINRALNLTNIHDWIDQRGTPYLTSTGAQRIAIFASVQIINVVCHEIKSKDEKGTDYIEITYSGTGIFLDKSIHEIGVASSKDEFFCKRKDKDDNPIFLPLSEIQVINIRKKAHTNFINRLIKNLLGIAPTWEELSIITKGKITLDKVVSIKNKKDQTPQSKAQRAEIRIMVMEICNNDQIEAKKYLNDVTSFTNKKGERIKGVSHVDRLSEKQIPIIHKKVSEAYHRLVNERGTQQ